MNCTIAPSYRLNLVRCLLHGVLFHWYFHSRRWLCIYGTYLDNNSVIFHEKFPNLPGFEPGIFWSVVRRVIHCATGPATRGQPKLDPNSTYTLDVVFHSKFVQKMGPFPNIHIKYTKYKTLLKQRRKYINKNVYFYNYDLFGNFPAKNLSVQTITCALVITSNNFYSYDDVNPLTMWRFNVAFNTS